METSMFQSPYRRAFMKHLNLPIAFGLVLLGWVSISVCVAGETKLSSQEIAEVLTNQTAEYVGGPIRQYFAVNGDTPYWDGSRLTHGTWSVAGDKYCSVWPPSSQQSCYAMYRTDDGNVVWVGDRNDRYVARMVNGNQMPAE